MLRLRTIAIALVVGCLLAGGASASIIPSPIAIDFRDVAWAPANGLHSYSVGSTTAFMLFQELVDRVSVPLWVQGSEDRS